MFVEQDLEPQPVEDLYPGDDGEAREEAHHAADPTDLVGKGHFCIPCDLRGG